MVQGLGRPWVWLDTANCALTIHCSDMEAFALLPTSSIFFVMKYHLLRDEVHLSEATNLVPGQELSVRQLSKVIRHALMSYCCSLLSSAFVQIISSFFRLSIVFLSKSLA